MAKKIDLVRYSKTSQDPPKVKMFRDPFGKDVTLINSPKPIGGLDKALGTTVNARPTPLGGKPQNG